MAPASKFPSAASRYKIVNAIGADDLRKRELAERKEKEQRALLERLRIEREQGPAAAAEVETRSKQVYLAYRQNGGDDEDRSRMTMKLTLPPAWMDKPCSKLVKAFCKTYNGNPKRDPIDEMASHLAGPDGVLFSPTELIKDVVLTDMETFFVVDPTKLDSSATIKAVSLHYKVEIASGVVVKSSPKAVLSDGSKPYSFGVKGKWACVEVDLVKDGWLKLSRNEVESYKGTHTYDTIAKERGDASFVECWMPAEHMKPVIVNPLEDSNASLVPVAIVNPDEKKRAGLRPSERRALREAGLDDSQIKKTKPKMRR